MEIKSHSSGRNCDYLNLSTEAGFSKFTNKINLVIKLHVKYVLQYRCNMLRCPLARLSDLQCFCMGHNDHGINLYGVVMILMGNLHAGGQSDLGQLSLLHRLSI